MDISDIKKKITSDSLHLLLVLKKISYIYLRTIHFKTIVDRYFAKKNLTLCYLDDLANEWKLDIRAMSE